MIFNTHSRYEGQHAFLGASNYHWINYDLDKLSEVYIRHLATQKGTELHEFAKRAIELKIRLPKSNKTLNAYVNDAIGFGLTPEQILFYSDNAFGTADAIGFKKNLLRIHDLKTGVSPTSMHQLEVYASLFCLEYKFEPKDIDMELRIYQNDQVEISNPQPEEINKIIDKIILFDKQIEKLKAGDVI